MSMNPNNFLNKYTTGGTLAIVLLFGFLAVQSSGDPAANAAEQTAIKDIQAAVYKSPNCGCCGAWAQYAERRGMNIEVKEVRNLNQVKEKHDIPQDKQSCHTTVVGDYVVEGHIPTSAINKLLSEEPDIQGIGLPGMPQGSPGMPGPKQEDWKIYSLQEDGTTSEFMTV